MSIGSVFNRLRSIIDNQQQDPAPTRAVVKRLTSAEERQSPAQGGALKDWGTTPIGCCQGTNPSNRTQHDESRGN